VTRGTAVELPESARDKLLALQLASDAALDSARSSNARLQTLPSDAADAMRSRLAGERDRHNSKHQQLSRLLNASKQWLASLRPGTVLEPAPAVDVALKNGETLSVAISSVREEIAATKRGLQSVRSAPLPQANQRDLIETYVVGKMRVAAPRVTILNDQLRVGWRGDTTSVEDVIALIALIAPEHLCRCLERQLEPEREGAMPAAERIKRVAELEARLLELERREEVLIMRAADDGLEVPRRSDANPAAVLNVAIAQAA
jgi:hypothetical protein